MSRIFSFCASTFVAAVCNLPISFLKDVIRHCVAEDAAKINLIQPARGRYSCKVSLLVHGKRGEDLVTIDGVEAQNTIRIDNL
jgi:hypothetical protein